MRVSGGGAFSRHATGSNSFGRRPSNFQSRADTLTAILVEKPNQKAIIIGKKGEKLKQIASQARKDMELLLGEKVYLEIWVKVKSGWGDNENILRNLGYE